MADATPVPTPSLPTPAQEIRVISHSPIMYWWPVWFFGLVFAIFTYMNGNRMIIMPNDGTTITEANGELNVKITKGIEEVKEDLTKDLKPKMHVHSNSGFGTAFLVLLFLIILITNVPLRGLWSYIVIMSIVLFTVLAYFLGWWKPIQNALGGINVHINMAGYIFLSMIMMIAWIIVVVFFDRRTTVVFSPGQIKVREEIGDREKVYDTTGLALERKADDFFRHVILGLGSGDLTIRTSGADRHEITLPNVFRISSKIAAIEQLVRERKINN
jgi:hypothetical protein